MYTDCMEILSNSGKKTLGVVIFLNSLNSSLYSYTKTLVLISQMFNEAPCAHHH